VSERLRFFKKRYGFPQAVVERLEQAGIHVTDTGTTVALHLLDRKRMLVAPRGQPVWPGVSRSFILPFFITPPGGELPWRFPCHSLTSLARADGTDLTRAAIGRDLPASAAKRSTRSVTPKLRAGQGLDPGSVPGL
jgi:hypothetical protein